MEHYLAALARATKTKLTATSEPWGTRVYKDSVPASPSGEVVKRPYVICLVAGGGRTGHTSKDFINLLWQIKAVANTQEAAYECRARLSALMNNADRGTVRELDGGNDWYILTCTEGQTIDLAEVIDSNRIYHAGATYRVLMESKLSVI